MPEPCDLLVVVPHLGAGGAQRVVSLLVNYWYDSGLRPAVLTLYGQADAHPLNPAIPRDDFAANDMDSGERTWLANRYLAAESRLTNAGSAGLRTMRWLTEGLLASMRAVRQARAFVLTRRSLQGDESYAAKRVQWLRGRFEAFKPRVILSFVGSTNIQTLLAARDLGIKVLISERNDPALQQLDVPWETMREQIYPEADIVTANSAGALRTMQRYIVAEKLRQVANPLDVPPPPATLERRQNRLVLVARLVPQKGVDVLLEAFARVAREAPTWQLDIVGDGPLRPQLEAQASALDIGAQTRFYGHVTDPFPLLYRASVFVLPSRFEGMPNSMLEAMACGLAVIVSDASPGPLELIRDEDTGLVFPVDDVDALAKTMRRVINDGLLRARLAQAATLATATMALPVVAAQWEELVRELGVELPASRVGT